MGGTASAGATGSEALFWNPAGLARMEEGSPADLSLSYNQLIDSTYAGAAAFAKPLGGRGTLAAGFVHFSQAPQTSYNALGDANGSFTPSDLAFSVGYGRRFGEVLAGGGVKVIRSAVADVSGASVAADIGVQALHVGEAGEGAVDVGGGVSNLGPPIKVGSVSAPLPMAVRGGVLWHTSPVLRSAVDLHLPVDQDPYVSLGLEGLYRQPQWTGFLRLGFNQARTRGIDGVSGVTAGAGLDLKRFRLDYAWVPFGDLGMTNRISVAFTF